MYTLGDVTPPATSGGGFWDSLTSGLKDIAPVLTQAYRERMILKAQLARANAGLPALDATQYSPPVRVETTVGPGAGTNRTLLMVGAGAAVLLGMYLLIPRRGRR